METLTYKYHLRASGILISFAAMALGALFLGNKALNNVRGLIINHIFELDADSATFFYWFFCIFFLLGALAFVPLLGRSFFSPLGKIILTESDLSVLHPFTGRERRVKLASVKGLTISVIHGRRFLMIEGGQTKIQVVSGCFDKESSFDEFYGHLKARIARAH